MTDLINRLRTGTHEQAVGLLLEVQEAVKPQPFLDGISPEQDFEDCALWNKWKANFDRLLQIGTPEACVGAAMMLMPEGAITEQLMQYEATLKWIWTLRFQSGRAATGRNKSAALAIAEAVMNERHLAAAIMETKND